MQSYGARDYFVGSNVLRYYLDRCVAPMLQESVSALQQIEQDQSAYPTTLFRAAWFTLEHTCLSSLELAKPFGWLKAAQIDKKESIMGETRSGATTLSVFDLSYPDLLVLKEMQESGQPVAV